MKIEYKGFIIDYSIFLNQCTFTTKENDESRVSNAYLINKAESIEDARAIIDNMGVMKNES